MPPPDLLALLTGLKSAVMLDYWFGNCGAPGEALAAVGQMILELRASYSAACPELAELRCVQLDDCVFLLRISLLRARRDAPPPLFLRLDGQNVVVGGLADAVHEVLELEPHEFNEPPSLGLRWRTHLILGMGRRNDRFTIILDIERVFSSEELGVLTGTAAPVTAVA
jgi:hypothetical protein